MHQLALTKSLSLSSREGTVVKKRPKTYEGKLNWLDSGWGATVAETISWNGNTTGANVPLLNPPFTQATQHKWWVELCCPLTCKALFTLPWWFSETLSHLTSPPCPSLFQKILRSSSLPQLFLQNFPISLKGQQTQNKQQPDSVSFSSC